MPAKQSRTRASAPKIQVALLLDVSNSMDNLIDQAKSQLWNIAKITGKIQCSGPDPYTEFALYEYGRETNDAAKGFVKQVVPFTHDLDKIFYSLTNLTTNGGDEYCGQVIRSAIDELAWDSNASSYKTIFIAGNESFRQGNVSWSEACDKARKKGVIVNTLFCGRNDEGVELFWNLGAECGNGSYTFIEQSASPFTVPTPYDTTLIVMNDRMKKLIIPYREMSLESQASAKHFDTVAKYDTKDIDKIVGYIVVRADGRQYNSAAWDIVDAAERDPAVLDTISLKNLADLGIRDRKTLKEKTRAMIEEKVQIRKKITALDSLRSNYIREEAKRQGKDKSRNFFGEIEKIISLQIKRYNMWLYPD